MSTNTSSPSETEGSSELNSGSDFLPPSNPTLDSYDFGNGETVSFLGDESFHTPPPPPPPQQPEQQHEPASTSVDWNQLLSPWSDAGGWAADMQIDPQLVGQDSDGQFVDPASVPAPGNGLDGALGHVMPTAQELAGLAPLLDAFPFTLDANGFPVMRQLLGDGSQALVPSASLEQSDSSSSIAASEDELARFARNSMGVLGSLPHSQIQANVKTPPASTGSSSNGSPKSVSPPAAPAPSAKATQPKSSHKEVESRYRGKVSAGILALRNAIPALRILDESPQPPCSVDERGYVDGLRPAPNDTRATVFAKAVEYISILKARENRLRKENDGLKALVSSLVGGPQLLDAWERSWREKYGSERDDEDRIAGEGSSNENDADDEEQAQARPVKKAKKASLTLDPQTGEKRKRGRPRKNPPAPPQQQQQPAPGQAQYLLAGFALFSLWNNAPGSSSSRSSAGHEGFVVANVRVDDAAASKVHFQWGHAVPAVHILASLVILASIFIPFIRRRWAAWRAAATPASGQVIPEAASSSSTPSELSGGDSGAASSAGPATPRLESHADLACAGSVSSDAEGSVIPSKAGAKATFRPSAQKGSFSQLASVADVLASAVGYALSTVCVPGLGCTEQGIEALVRRAEALVVEGEDAPLSQRFQTFFTLLASRPHRAAHRAALALLSHSLGMADAAAEAWAGIRPETACERVVLGRLGVEAAHDRLLELAASEEHDRQEGAVDRLARDWARTEAPALARDAFLCAARGAAPDMDRVEVLRAVGAELGEAGLALAVCSAVSSLTSSVPALSEVDLEDLDLGDAETEDVLRALLLFRRAFPAACLALARDGEDDEASGKHTLPSPPPSPAPRDSRTMLALQQVLGRAVFDAPALEDARDRIVDMVSAAGRTNRRRTAAFAF